MKSQFCKLSTILERAESNTGLYPASVTECARDRGPYEVKNACWRSEKCMPAK
jgi:hypothetical protein